HVFGDAIPERRVVAAQLARAAAHLLHHLGDEERLEFLGRGLRLRAIGGIGRGGRRGHGGRLASRSGAGPCRQGVDGVHAQITTSSPSIAPAWSSACRIAMMSSGVAPMLLTTSMIVCSCAPAGQANMRPEPCSTETPDSGVTTVSPRPNGAG